MVLEVGYWILLLYYSLLVSQTGGEGLEALTVAAAVVVAVLPLEGSV